jgi:8-amino-7-oxononanoate synthase
VRIIEAEPGLAGRARARAGQLARICGVPATDGAVVPVLIGEAAAAFERSVALRERGIAVGCFRPPSVPAGTARLRLTARADLTDADLERFCQTWQAVSSS